jgi:hypothetical protein
VHLVATTYHRAGERPAAIAIEVTPDIFIWPPNPMMEVEYENHWGTPRDFLDRLMRSPEEGLALFGRRYALGGFSANYISFRLNAWLDEDVPRWFEDQTEDQRLEAMWELPPRLTVENHGSPTVTARAETLRRYHELSRARRTRLVEEAVARLEGGQIREELVPIVVGAVAEARAAADEVVLFVLPRNPCGRFSPAYAQRAARFVERLDAEIDAPMIDLTDSVTSCDDFMDLTHLSPLGGAPNLSRALAQRLTEHLR